MGQKGLKWAVVSSWATPLLHRAAVENSLHSDHEGVSTFKIWIPTESKSNLESDILVRTILLCHSVRHRNIPFDYSFIPCEILNLKSISSLEFGTLWNSRASRLKSRHLPDRPYSDSQATQR